MEKIKIVHILHCVGGVDVYLRLITLNIDSDRFENIILHGQKDTNENFFNKKNQQLKEYKIPILREISIYSDLIAIRKGYKILKKEKPDLIHCHSAKGGIIGRILGFLLNIKVLYTPHAFSYLSSENVVKKKVFLLIERFFANGNSILVSTSKSEELKGILEVGYKENKSSMFVNSINPINKINNLTIDKTWPDEYICTVGRPSYQKNIELMIRVLNVVRKNNNIHLVIMGVGHHSDKLENVKKLIDELKLNDSVTLIEWTDRENIFNIINNSKFYISTARYEGLPYSVIESLALSKPCIVSDCDGNRDLIQNDYNGFVIQDENIEDFNQRIQLLLNNSTLLAELSKNARESFDENYNIRKNIKNLEKIYRRFSKSTSVE